MPTEFDLSWILPYVRESLRGRGNFTFDGFADGVFTVLDRVGVKGIEKRPPHQGYTGYAYNFDAAHLNIRLAVTEAFYYLEQNRFILRQPPSNATLWSAKIPFNRLPAHRNIVTFWPLGWTRLGFIFLNVADFKGVRAG